MEAKRLVIVGAGDVGLEAYSWLKDNPELNQKLTFAGFVDDKATTSEEGPILGTTDSYAIQPDDIFLAAIGSPAARLKVCTKLKNRGAEFISFVHPTARFDCTASLGTGSIIGPMVYVGPKAQVGDFCLLNVHCTIGHHVIIEDSCTINSHADVTGHVVLREGAYLGSHASVLQNIEVGSYAIVGAGSVALRNVASRTTVMGIPAKSLGLPTPDPNQDAS